MFKRLNDMPAHSRVWIFQGNRMLDAIEEKSLADEIHAFISDWSSHGKSLSAAMEVLHHRFLVLAADEKEVAASGCSIDKVFHFVQSLTHIYKVDFMDRMIVVYMNDGVQLQCSLNQFWAMKKAGLVSEDTLLFDNTVKEIASLHTNWLVPFNKSWHQQMWNH